ncbi:serine/threonine-protein kinase gin4 [Marasmius sp. AFHP31]|nr:serine/threonine-protein kinase gin4 [Marasmius sp. AFHP31]
MSELFDESPRTLGTKDDPKLQTGAWKMVKPLGKGSSVMLARHAETGQMTAVKIVSKSLPLTPTDSLDHPASEAEYKEPSLQREMIVMDLIEDPNVMHGPNERSSPRFSSSKPLKRGRACLNCRFLKIKCDGAHPPCGSCERQTRLASTPMVPQDHVRWARALEDAISRLEARLKELEIPYESSSVASLRTKLRELTSASLAQTDTSVHLNPSPPMPDTPSTSCPNTSPACRDCFTTFRHVTHPENSRLERENAMGESIQNQNEYRATAPSASYHSDTIHTNSHNTNTTTNSHSHNVHITNVHHHHNKPRRWSVTTFVHQIATVCVPVFWYPYSGWHHVPHSSFGSWVNGWWGSTWAAWPRWGWHWGV